MSCVKRIALSRSTPLTDSDSAIGEDYDEDNRNHKKTSGGKDKLNRNISEKKRRDQFNMLVNELCTMVSTNNKKMDKSTVLKSTISFLKAHQESTNHALVQEINEDWKPSFLTNDEFMYLMLEALDSFLLVFSLQGVILYVSESIRALLGHLPNDLINKSIYDFIEKSDYTNLHNIMYNYSIAAASGLPDESQFCLECKFCRSCIDPKDTVKFERVIVRGSFRHTTETTDDGESSGLSSREQTYFLCTVQLQSSHLVREIFTLDNGRQFTSRLSLEWKFLFMDHRAPPIIGYLPFEVLGTSGYDYYHPDDLDGVTLSHEQLMKTGEGLSCYYRFLTKGQQWIWLQSCFYITYHQWNSKPEFINCTNTVVSYPDILAQKRKDSVCEEDTQLTEHTAPSLRRMSQSLSVCSVTSEGRSDSTTCELPDKDHTQYPTSTTSIRSYSLSQQFLQRYLQQQQQCCQTTVTTDTDVHTPSKAASKISQLPVQHILQQNQQVHLQQQKPAIQPERILPRLATSEIQGHPMTLPANVFMTPIQRQLYEQLQRKAGQVQSAILKQQEELMKINQQLLFSSINSALFNSNTEMVNMISGESSQVPPQLNTTKHAGVPQQIVDLTQSQGVSRVSMHNMPIQSQWQQFSLLPQNPAVYITSETADSSQTTKGQDIITASVCQERC